MARCLPAASFATWFAAFLPRIGQGAARPRCSPPPRSATAATARSRISTGSTWRAPGAGGVWPGFVEGEAREVVEDAAERHLAFGATAPGRGVCRRALAGEFCSAGAAGLSLNATLTSNPVRAELVEALSFTWCLTRKRTKKKAVLRQAQHERGRARGSGFTQCSRVTDPFKPADYPPHRIAVRPGRVGSGADPLGQDDPAHGPRREVLRIQHHAFRPVCRHIGHQSHQIPVVLVHRADARREGRLAAETLLAEQIVLARTAAKSCLHRPRNRNQPGSGIAV